MTTLYKYFSGHPVQRNLVLLFIVAICAVLSLRIEFEEDISKMFRMDGDSEELAVLLEKTKSAEQLIARIYPRNGDADADAMIEIADSLAALVESECEGLIAEVKVRVRQEDFLKIYSTVARNFPAFVGLPDSAAYAAKLDSIDAAIKKYTGILATPGGMFAREGLRFDPAGFTADYLAGMKKMQAASGFTVIDEHVFSKDEHNLLFFIVPKNKYGETGNNSKLIDRLNRITERFNAEAHERSNFAIQYFGAPLVAVGNSEQIRKDVSLTVAVVLACIMALLISIFGKKRMPLLIAATIGFSTLFALAVISLVKPAVSLIAIGSGAVILGIAANYPVHFFTHYVHNKNVEATIRAMLFPMTIGSLTTVCGFLCLTFTRSPLLHDFGLFGAFCLIGAALFSLIFLPHLFGEIKESGAGSRKFFEALSRRPLDRKPALVALIAVLTGFFLYFSFDVEYESDLNSLNYMSPTVKEAETQFNALSGTAGRLTLISTGKSPEETLENSYEILMLTDSLSAAGIKCSYVGVSAAVPPKRVQRKNVDSWNAFRQASNDGEKIKSVLTANNLNTAMLDRFFDALDGKATIIPDDDYRYLVDVFGSDDFYSGSPLYPLVSHIGADDENPATIAAIAEAVNKTGHTKVLNKRLLTEDILSGVSDDFNKITLYTSLIVFLTILISYGRIELTLITFVPMVISWIWILGIMGLFGIKFNIVNIILSTFIFGLGDDFCIFTTDGCLKSYRGQGDHTSVTRMSIMISGLTALIGFCSLLFAGHPAIYSLAAISVLGILSVLFISQTLQPFLFRIFISKPAAAGHAPVSLLTVLNSIFFFGYFISGSLILTVVTLFLRILPAKRRTRKLILHCLICRLCRSLVFFSAMVRKTKINLGGETFSRPAIIIANHQSMVDILYLLTLSPKIVFVVKSWVWNSPVMGVFVRFAGFHTLADGMGSVESYAKTLAEGYSIVVFPEGSRSENAEIKRFHKGAFFLAERLEADIIPIVLYNNNEVLPKGSFMVYSTRIAMQIHERISPDDRRFGKNYKERTAALLSFYRREYAKMSENFTDSRYCLRKLRDGFMYRGPVLEWYLRIKFKMENGYADFDKLVPPSGKIIDAGCGYGFHAFTMAMKRPERKILALDYDNDKIAEAANCLLAGNLDNLRFLCADLAKYEFDEPFDCIVFSDVLHYLGMEEIENIIRKVAEKLNPDGIVIVRDADVKDLRFNRFSEFLSTGIFRFNKTTAKLNFFTGDELCAVFLKYGFVCKTMPGNGFAINTCRIATRKNEAKE